MASKLQIYNDALLALGSRRLASLTTDTEARRALDEVYTRGVEYCLAQGFWKFAMRTSKIDYSPAVATDFGYTYGFEKPTDMVRPFAICIDEDLKVPLLDFSQEGSFWFAYVTEIYISYVSNHEDFGMAISEWPESFSYFVSLHLAERIFNRVKADNDGARLQSRANLQADLKKAKNMALSQDAMQAPPTFLPSGTWANSRGANGSFNGGRRDRGSRGTLIG